VKKNLFYIIICNILHPFLNFTYKLSIIGSEKIPKSGRLIICSNHTSNADPILLALASKRPIRFMSKSELFKNKIFAMFLKKVGAFPVNRKGSSGDAISVCFKILEDEEVLGIFIEGTRSKTGKLLRPKSGASMISLKTGTPILPVCISSTKNDGKVKIFTKTKVEFGDVIFPDEILFSKKDDILNNKKEESVFLGGISKLDLKLINEEIMAQIAFLKAKI
jgi:1-acyl-sn-glycerol-3-phosphate acyltransferase